MRGVFSIRYAQAQEVEIRAKQLSRAVEKHFMESFRSAKLKEMSEILLACQGQKTIIFVCFSLALVCSAAPIMSIILSMSRPISHAFYRLLLKPCMA